MFKMSFNTIKHSIIFVLLFFISFIAVSQRDIIEFERISIEQGLSQSTIFCILQDHKGYMWFGTEDGLNRYDGYDFKVFNRDDYKENSLSNNRVIDLLEDFNNTLWVATIGGGLNKFDYKTETFSRFSHNPNDSNSLSNNRVMVLCEDPSRKIWVGTADGGLNLFDPNTSRFEVFMNTPQNPNIIPDNTVRALFVDSKGVLWVGTNNGACTYNRKTNSFYPLEILDSQGKKHGVGIIRKFFEDVLGNIWIATDSEGVICYLTSEKKYKFFNNENGENSLAHNSVFDIYQDEKLFLWFATYGGLQRFNPATEVFETYSNNSSDPKSLSSNLVRSIYEDKLGVIWIGTYNDGICKFSQKFRKFEVYRNQANRPLEIAPSTIRAFWEDTNGFVWIATYGSGLLKFDYANQSFTQYRSNPSSSLSLTDDNVTSLVGDRDGLIWVGTTDGLCVLDQNGRICKVYKEDRTRQGALAYNSIRTLYVDRQDELWIGTSGGGLMKYNRHSDTFISYMPDINNPESSISQDRVLSIFEDDMGNLWVGTSGEGLNLFNRNTGEFTHYKSNRNDINSISSNRILSIFQDSKGRLWIGTGGGGLNLFNYTSKTFTAIKKSDGLPSDVVFGIVEYNDTTLWLSTNNGICNFNPSKYPYKFRIFSKIDGLQSNEFSEGAYMKTRAGLFYFGGINGFNIVNPSQLLDNPYPPEVYITRARIEEKGKSEGNTFDILLHENDRIELPYYQNNITFYFTGLHYIAPNSNRYRYILENFESTWNEPLSNQRFAVYTNLRPGKYSFKVIASNSDGIWCDEGDEISIVIKPPFWYTWWFITIAFIFAGALVTAIVIYRDASLLKSKRELESMVEQRTSEITRKNNEMLEQAERIRKANEEITITSQALANQNKQLQEKNEEILLQHNELEEQRNSLANIAWELQDKNEEITNQRNEIQKQRDMLTSQQKEITDSIMYAKRIQQAILPTYEQVKECFSDFFVFYRPKSIVSGDFYWVTRIDKYRIIAVADCTGHGVPGGFMSMLGAMLLNEVIVQRQVLNPALALDQLRQSVISVLHQKGQVEDAGDGMDISLCIINDEESTISYAGAFSSIIMVEHDTHENSVVKEIQSDRMPISFHLVMRPFSNQVFKLKKDTYIYLFTDGLTDQFGGENGKKFRITRFHDFIKNNYQLPLKSQGLALEREFDAWKGSYFQVDDVLAMGLRV